MFAKKLPLNRGKIFRFFAFALLCMCTVVYLKFSFDQFSFHTSQRVSGAANLISLLPQDENPAMTARPAGAPFPALVCEKSGSQRQGLNNKFLSQLFASSQHTHKTLLAFSKDESVTRIQPSRSLHLTFCVFRI